MAVFSARETRCTGKLFQVHNGNESIFASDHENVQEKVQQHTIEEVVASENTHVNGQSMARRVTIDSRQIESKLELEGGPPTKLTDMIPNVIGHEEALLEALWAIGLPQGPHAEQVFRGTEWTSAHSAFIAPSLTERSNAWLSTPISQLVRDELRRDRQDGLPELTEHGHLPPGIHHTSFQRIADRFAWNSHRAVLLRHLEIVLRDFRDARVREVIVAGSFVSSTDHPGDIDMVYVRNADIDQLALLTALWKGKQAMIHAWAADREHIPIASRPFDPTRRFSFLQFLRSYQSKELRGTTAPVQPVGVVHLSLNELDVDEQP